MQNTQTHYLQNPLHPRKHTENDTEQQLRPSCWR